MRARWTRTIHTALGFALLVVVGGCQSSGSNDSDRASDFISADEVADVALQLINDEIEPADRSELVAGNQERENQLLAIDAVAAQADSELLVEADNLTELAAGVSESLLTVKLAPIEGIREEERIVGQWPVVACRCDGDDVQLSPLSFCSIVRDLGAPCEP